MHVDTFPVNSTDSERLGVRPQKPYCSLCRFLHDRAEIPGKSDLSLPLHRDSLNNEDIASRLGPCQSDDGSDFFRLWKTRVVETRRTEILLQQFGPY